MYSSFNLISKYNISSNTSQTLPYYESYSMLEQAIKKVSDYGRPLYLTVFGSHLYGTNTVSSDKDYKGLFLPSIKKLVLDEKVNSISLTTGENNSKDIIYLAATLNVPIGSKALYSNVKGWKKFANIQETEFTGVETIKQKSTPTSYYSISGEKRNNVHRGVNIIRMSDGTTRKVVVK